MKRPNKIKMDIKIKLSRDIKPDIVIRTAKKESTYYDLENIEVIKNEK